MEKLNALIEQGESETLEFKTAFGNETIETIVAFANQKGGKVLLGVADNGRITGVSISQETVQNWVNEVKTKTIPILIPDVEIVEIESSKHIVVFTIQEYPIKPVSFRGRYLKRNHNSNILLSVNEVVDIHLKTFNSSWDYHTNNDFKKDNISFEKVQTAIDRINISGKNIIEDPLSFLFKKDLIREGLITNAAYLLFTSKESIFTTIELGRFQTDIIIKDSARTKNDIISQVEEVIDFVKKHINKEIVITSSPQNIEKWQYPMEAIREIVMNMIVHRDYRDTSDSIVKIYDHKIEFFNPGRLPDNITEQDLLDNKYKSTPRNKLIADIFKEIGFIEKYGSGIQRIINYFSAAGLPKPSFQNQSNGFLVTVFTNVTENVTENITENVTENRLKKIIELLQLQPNLTTNDLAKRLEITRMTLHRDLEKLKELTILERIGPDKGGYWKINQI